MSPQGVLRSDRLETALRRGDCRAHFPPRHAESQAEIPKEEDNRRGKVTKPNKYGDLAVSGFPFAREAQAGCNAPGERCERIAVGNSARFWLNRDIELFRREVL